jgi:hypothetical protein
MIYRVWAVAIFGGIWILTGIYAWGMEPSAEPDVADDEHADDGPEDSAGDADDAAEPGSPELEPVGN